MHIGPVWPNMASRSNLKGVNERSRLFVGAVISPWRRWIASPPCSAIRPRCHLTLGEDTARPPYQAAIARTRVQVCATFRRFLIATARLAVDPERIRAVVNLRHAVLSS